MSLLSERLVEFVIAPGLVANGDARLLRIVLENLLGNAWKFTGKHPRARIEFGLTEYDGKPAYSSKFRCRCQATNVGPVVLYRVQPY